jgi:hypothetical protein
MNPYLPPPRFAPDGIDVYPERSKRYGNPGSQGFFSFLLVWRSGVTTTSKVYIVLHALDEHKTSATGNDRRNRNRNNNIINKKKFKK